MMTNSRLNIAIVGAGVMGLSAAQALRKHTITIFDLAGFPANNASFMAGGMLAPYSEIEYMKPEFMDAALHGIEIWKRILPEVNANGSLIIAHKDDEYILERLASKLAPLGVGEQQKIAVLEPDLAARFESGLFVPYEANIDPKSAMEFLSRKLNKHIDAASPEKLAEDYDYVIDCRGFAAEATDKDLRGVKGEVAFIRNREFSLSRPVRLAHPRYPLYIVPRPQNIFMIGATIIESEGQNATLKSAMELLSAAYSLHPSFADAEITEIKAGIRPAYPDNLPRITIDGNIIRCNGLFRHGWLLAPVMAECTADYVDGRDNQFISLFRRKPDADHHQRPEKNHRRCV